MTEARTAVARCNQPRAKGCGCCRNQFEGALKKLICGGGELSWLRATENFQQLQAELVDTEDKIQASRRFYNGGVRDLNTKIEQFPNNLIASMFGFAKRGFFEVEDHAAVAEPVQVKF